MPDLLQTDRQPSQHRTELSRPAVWRLVPCRQPYRVSQHVIRGHGQERDRQHIPVSSLHLPSDLLLDKLNKVTVFPCRNSTDDPSLVNKAAKVMEILIENYAVSSLFGAENLQFFADVTSSGIVVTERFTFQYKYPSQQNMDRE